MTSPVSNVSYSASEAEMIQKPGKKLQKKIDPNQFWLLDSDDEKAPEVSPLQKQFDFLVSSYAGIHIAFAGRPECKANMDIAYLHIEKFVRAYPQFKNQLPKKVEHFDDKKTQLSEILFDREIQAEFYYHF